MSDIPGYDSPEAALAAVAADVEQAHARAERASAWREQATTLVGAGRADGGDARIEIDVDGTLSGVFVSDRLAQAGGAAVSRALHQAMVRAQESLRSQSAELTEDAFGAGSTTAAVVAAELAANTVAPEAPEEPPEEGQARDTRPGAGSRSVTAPGAQSPARPPRGGSGSAFGLGHGGQW
ncbi:MAG: hypothetical protein LWW86_16480 [Micrococcales bacterium]|nr:hypothetical protein [Micrococcales bacterium]